MNYLEDWLFWNLVSRFMVRGWFVIISSIIGSRFHSLSPKFCHIPHHRSPFNSLGLEVISISKRKPTTKNLLKQNPKKSNRKKKEIDKKTWDTMPKTNKQKGKGDYFIHCSKDVYFGALLFLIPNKIRHCEEKSQWMKMGKRQGGWGGRWK